ncbi:MAG: alanine dehydrogenase [Planctomycetota bacterium]
MIVGVPKETKKDEYRVGIAPAGVQALAHDGHRVLIEKDAGMGSGLTDHEFSQAGAEIVRDAAGVYRQADMIMKVKEPLAAEWPLLRRDQIVFTYFHFAANAELTETCRKAGIIAIAYETIRDEQGRHPLLTPMSEIAGRMSIHQGAKYLERPMGGRGVLLSGVPGVKPATVVILGGGVVGANAARIAAGMGAIVYILDISLDRLRYLADVLPANVVPLISNSHTVSASIAEADLIIGAVLIEGARAPQLVSRSDLKVMKPGAVIIDVAIDQGGCVETSRPTTHSDPTFVVDNILHYCVANMPGAVGRTSTFALTNSTVPYARRIARLGWLEAARSDAGLLHGLNMAKGAVLNRAVAETFGLPCATLKDVA